MIDVIKLLIDRLSEKTMGTYRHNKKLQNLLGLGLIRSRKPINFRKRERMIRFLKSI